jgi:hypothetical protein
MSAQWERIVELAPAWDRRHADPKKNYGIHGVELKMVLKGPEGAVQFVVYTNWHLPHVTAEHHLKTQGGDVSDVALSVRYDPLPADVGYHSPHPMYEGQEPISTTCPYVDGPCYYDGSGLRASDWFESKLLPGGSDAIWAALEEDYRERFCLEAGEIVR